MSEKKKSIAKVLGGLLALFGSAFGASEAGVMPDLGELERLGVLGTVLLIAYIEIRLLPWLLPIRRHAVSKVGEQDDAEAEEAPAVPKRAKVQRSGPTLVKGEPT
jgi:hypothetical protein